MRKVLMITVRHKCGKVEYVEIDTDRQDAAERIAYCMENNASGYLKVETVSVTEI